MKDLENGFLLAYLVSNTFALILLFFAATSPRTARILFFLLFAVASVINWKICLQSPEHYVSTSQYALVIYRQFITGWFSNHVVLVVGFIATAQVFIAVSLLLKGWMYKTGVIGAIVFLLAIMPLGIASAFPSTLIMAYAMVWLLNRKVDYVWVNNNSERKDFSLRNRNITKHSLHQR